LHLRPQPGAHQRVVHGDQALGQRHADMVLELQRCRTGTTLRPVHDDEVRGGTHRQHRLADRQHLHLRAHAQLEPGRFPPASSRIRAMNSTSSVGVANTRCAEGLTHFCPWGTCRMRAISADTFGPGSTPPIPGLAPWLSFSETHFTWSLAATAVNSSGSKSPSGVRVPK